MSEQEDLMRELIKKLDQAEEVKPSWKDKLGKGKVQKGYARFIIIKDNKNIEVKKTLVTDGTAMIDGFPRIANPDYCLMWKGVPTYILPSWSMKPFSPAENYSETERDKMNMAGRRVILSKLEMEQIKPKKGLGGFGGWIIFAVIGIGVLYYFLKGGNLF